MKYLLSLTLLLSTHLAICQNSEFKIFDNGFIYSDQTMSKLEAIVDSLNLKYKTCDINKVFQSKQQAIGHYVSLSGSEIQAAREDMDDGITFEEFEKKYPDSKTEKNRLVVKYHYENYEGKEVVEFSEVAFSGWYGAEVSTNDLEIYTKALKQKWIYEENDKSLYAFFFPNGFSSDPIPNKYSRMIGYADCLIDTNENKFYPERNDGWVDLPNNWQKMSLKKKKSLLDEMRKIYVVGFCSMDSRPRDHAVNIALLSAETTNWEVFLRAHLDIMNDRFDRMTDGNYAWKQRQTYIGELEELNINVADLIFGINLYICK